MQKSVSYTVMGLLLYTTTCFSSINAFAQDDGIRDRRRITSTTQRFVIINHASYDVVYLSIWAEDVADRIEKIFGRTLPFQRGAALYLIVKSTGESGAGSVRAAQYVDEFGLRQKLYISNIKSVDQELLLESMCWLLINRYAIAINPALSENGRLAAVPAWLAVGAAQNLFPELRKRNTDVAAEAWAAGRGLDFQDVLSCVKLESWPPDKKAFSGQAFAALNEWFQGGTEWGALCRIYASNQITDPLILAELAGFVNIRDLEAAWDLWLVSRQDVRGEWAVLKAGDFAKLDDLLRITPETLKLFDGRESSTSLALSDLIADRDARWVSAVSMFLVLKLDSFALGRSRDLQAVISKYRDYLQALSHHPGRGGWYKFWRSSRPSDGQLVILLKEAEDARINLEARLTLSETPVSEPEPPPVKESDEYVPVGW